MQKLCKNYAMFPDCIIMHGLCKNYANYASSTLLMNLRHQEALNCAKGRIPLFVRAALSYQADQAVMIGVSRCQGAMATVQRPLIRRSQCLRCEDS